MSDIQDEDVGLSDIPDEDAESWAKVSNYGSRIEISSIENDTSPELAG